MSWTNLPTDYADATWVGDRKYTITLDNGQQQQQWAESKIVDTTQYEPATSGGNIFYGANDANQTNDAINKIVAALGNDINNLKVNIANGGTGANNDLGALINLGISDSNQMDFQANDFNSWISQVQSYVDSNLETRRPFVFHAGWQGVGYGAGLAYQTLDTGLKFLIIFNENSGCGVKYYFKRPNENWIETSSNRGTVIYSNSSGATGTITLSDYPSNYDYVDITYKNYTDNNAVFAVTRVFAPFTNKKFNLFSVATEHDTNAHTYSAWFKCPMAYFSGNAMIYHQNKEFSASTADTGDYVTTCKLYNQNTSWVTEIRGFKL